MSTFNTHGLLVAGALAAIGAPVCCVGPLMPSMLSIGGAWGAHLTALEPSRPWFIAAMLPIAWLALLRLFLSRVCVPAAQRFHATTDTGYRSAVRK